jgi:hypothetical protein
LQLSLDWFRAYARSQYSVGAIYVSIVNLPRDQRYRRHNIHTLGVLPGPQQQPLDSYLTVIVKELLTLWRRGVNGYRVRLLIVSGDLPAVKKLMGLNSCSSHRGCGKCTAYFPTIPDQKRCNFGISETFPLRTDSWVRQQSTKWLQLRTNSAREKLTKETGVRWTPLCLLPYLNLVDCVAIDYMHLYFLGVTKHLFSVYKQQGFLTRPILKQIQQTLDSARIPSHLCRLKGKLASGLSGLKADEWKGLLLYGHFLLDPFVPPKHLALFLLLAEANRLTCRRYLSYDSINKAQQLLDQFESDFRALTVNTT